MAQFIYTGNEVNVFMNGMEIDLLQNLRGTDDYGPEPVSGIGDIHAKENAPTFARHAVTISKFALRKEKAITAGIISENGNAILLQTPFAVEVFAKLTGKLLRKYLGVTLGSDDLALTAHRVIVVDANFVAIDVVGTMADGS